MAQWRGCGDDGDLCRCAAAIARSLRLDRRGDGVGSDAVAGAAVNDAQFIETASGANEGNVVLGVPEWTANANVEWDLPFVPGFTMNGRVVHTGAQQVNAANTLAIPDWTRFDVGARCVVAAGDLPVTLRLTVDNVANSRLWASAFDVFSAA